MRGSTVALVAVLLAGCATQTAQPTATPTASPPPSATVTPSASVEPTASMSPTPSVAPSPTASPSAPATPSATVSPTPAPAPQWERVGDQESLAGSRMLAVAAGPDGFVAVGTTDDEEPVGIAWISVDGRTWTRAADELADGQPNGIIWDGNQYVAFGGGASVEPPAVWTSADGQHWQRASGISDAEVTYLFVARHGNELIAIGGEWGDGELARTDTVETWSSADGLVWQLRAAEASPLGLSGLGGLTSANGTLVAWGWTYPDGGADRRMVVLRSTDGLTWESSTVGKLNDWIGDILGSEDGFVAVGAGPYCCEAGGTTPVKAWTSADGRAWQRADFEPAAGDGELGHVVHHGGRYVALGPGSISWLSFDGTVWTEAESVPDSAVDGDPCTGGPCPLTMISALAAGDQGLVAVGLTTIVDDDGDPIGTRSVTWIAPTP